MQDKMRIQQLYLQEFLSVTIVTCVQITRTAILDGEIVCILFGKAKSRRENKMKKTSEQDTGLCRGRF